MTVLERPTDVGEGGTLEGLVRQHLDLVYAAAQRQMRDPHAAADVTQAVFLILQMKLPSLGANTVMPVWLLRVTRYACLAARRRERRRMHHETKAKAMRSELREVVEPDEESLRMIDEALDRLSKADRTAVVLSYFAGQSHQQVAAELGIGTEAAHKRIQRAVGKLRKILEKRGIPAAGVAGALALVGKPAAAPAALAQGVLGCMGGHAMVGGVAQAIAKGTMIMMHVMKVQVAVLALVTAGAVTLSAVALGQVNATVTEMPAAGAAAPVANSGPAVPADEFAPIVTLTVVPGGPNTPDSMADLDSGKTSSAPQEAFAASRLGLFDWVADKGWDINVENRAERKALMGLDMAFTMIDAAQFDRVTAAQVVRDLITTSPTTPAIMGIRALPATFNFRTREGGVGVLQVLEISDEGLQPVKFRYKLIKAEARDLAAAQTAARDLLPEFERILAQIPSAPADQKQKLCRFLVRSGAALAEMTRGTPYEANARRTSVGAMSLMNALLANDSKEEADAQVSLRKALDAASQEIIPAAVFRAQTMPGL